MAASTAGFFILIFVIGLSTILGSPSNTGPPPHIIFIVADDLGFHDVGFRSHQILTPNIDSFASNGVVLDQYYVQDVCSPSRATFMTGRFAMHHSIVDWIPSGSAYGLPLNETTLAEKMQEAGYATHAIGKWHLGFYKSAFTPTFRGFDSFYGFYSGGEDYFKHNAGHGYDFRRDPKPRCGVGCSQVAWEAKGKYSTTLFAEEAVQVIKAHDTSKPLFLYLAFQAVHAPAQVPASYITPYTDIIPEKKRRTFAGMLSCMDEGIGNVTRALHEKKMDDNLLIIFTTDNGGPTTTGDGVGARNWPLRGGKHSIWEGGTRGTAVIYGTMLQRTGYEYKYLMHGADWLPTLCDLVNVGTNGTLPLDGVSQWKAISSGDAPDQPRTQFVYGNSTNMCSWKGNVGEMAKLPCGFGIRSENWKLLLAFAGGPDTWCNSTAHGAKCEYYDLCFPGNDIRTFACNNPIDCAMACTNDTTCKGWTLNAGTSPSTCYIKTALNEDKASEGNCISGSSGTSKAPNMPVKSCAGGFCLYDINADPYEHKEISKDHPDVVKQLRTKMMDILTSYTQYSADKSCPPVVFPNDTHVGPVWAPWCN